MISRKLAKGKSPEEIAGELEDVGIVSSFCALVRENPCRPLEELARL